jgi:hypothetical protein
MQGTMKRVLIPVKNEKTGKTYWNRGGISLPNRDGSWNVYLDVLPLDGKLQLRDFDEEDRRGGPRSDLGGGNPDRGGPEAGGGTQIPF